jgi:two-component system, sensor histidine kinase and response regulator
MAFNRMTLKVFVVDTDEQMCDSVQWVLEGRHVVHADVEEKISFDVRCFESRESFLSALPAGKPDILFIDNNLPGKGGMDLLEELHRKKMHICTIMTASSVTMERAIRSLMLGGYDFLAKPISPVKLRFHVYKAARYVVLSRRAAQMAREKKKIRFEFISVLAHELKAPLNALESYVDVIKNKRSGENSEDYGVMLDRMRIRTQGMRKLITDLLDLTSIESGERRRRLEDLDLTAIAREMAEGLKEEANRGRITINLTPEEPVMFKADADDMEMILRNLISNAIKYNRPDGTISITIAPGDKGVVIEVTDDGIGISKEEQSLLFKEFSRIKNEETASIAGSGLGLSIVKKIVALYNGEISVESTKGKGTRFRIILRGKDQL